jgi:DNA-binding MarR family transcriptional regulator
MSEKDLFYEALRDWVEASMQRSMHAFIRYARQSALSFSQISSLFRLYHRGPSPVNELAEHLGVTMAAVSQLLAPLEETGLIQRTEDQADRRVKRIALTDQGIQRVQESMHARHAWLEDLAALITSEEKTELLSPILRLNQFIDALNQEAGYHCADPCGKKINQNQTQNQKK